MDRSETTDLRKALAALVICLALGAVCLGVASGARGLERWVLVGGGAVWASIGITAWLVILSPYGWFGALGRWVDRFMQDDYP